jgi:deazaflavin-dependent oxidoreductase (nitroreductase family)
VSAEPAVCHVTTTGRRSGRPHRIEIWFAREGETLYLLAGGRHRADWVRNLLVDPAVEVELAGRRRPAQARALAGGTEEDRRARRLLLDKYQEPGSHHLDGWGERALAVAVDLVPEP